MCLTVSPKNMEELLGPRRYKRDENAKKDEIGLVNGLAWTSVGGEMLPIEVAVMDGTGKIGTDRLPGRCDEREHPHGG